MVRGAYAKQAALKEELESRLHLKASTSGYAKALREAGSGDGETILNRLATSNDADLLNSLQTNFPKTAQALKQYHVDALLNKALSKAAPGETISSTGLRAALKKMSPELREFAVSPEARNKIEAVGQMLDKIKESRLGNTGGNMTRDSLTEHLGRWLLSLPSLTTTRCLLGA